MAEPRDKPSSIHSDLPRSRGNYDFLVIPDIQHFLREPAYIEHRPGIKVGLMAGDLGWLFDFWDTRITLFTFLANLSRTIKQLSIKFNFSE